MRQPYTNKPILSRFAILAVILLFLLLLLCLAAGWVESRSAKPEARGDHRQRLEYEDTIAAQDSTYRRRQNLTTILVMGIDRLSNAGASGFRNGGQADFLRLVAIDHQQQAVYQLQIDRDTMTPITVLGVLGDELGTRTAQICLSHGFGDGREQSCVLTRDAVSHLLMDMPIDFYLAMNMDGICVLNDWLGGVTVTLEDDFSSLDPAMTEGSTLTLQGKQAEIYVRYRRGIGAGTNERRMTRQKEYISQLTQLLKSKGMSSQETLGTLYDTMAPYLLTDMARGRIINELWAARAYTSLPPLEPAGEYTVGEDGFMEFHPDPQCLKQMVLELVYEQVN